MYQCNQDLSVGLFHSFNVVTICLPDGGVKNYLIDCTYQQYFLVGQNFKNRYLKSASHVVTCEIGNRVVNRNYEGTKKLYSLLQTEPDWYYERQSRVEIDPEKGMLTVAGNNYRIGENVVVIAQG